MKIKKLFNELKKKKAYQNFKKEYPDSFLTAGFFILSTNEKESDKIQLDFFLPHEKKIASFEYPFVSFIIHEDEIEKATKITNLDPKIDINNIKQTTEKVLGGKFTKIIAILQNEIWNVTALYGITIKRMKINAYTEEIAEAGDLSLNDVMRINKK